LKQGQQSLLFADDKDLASKLKLVEDQNRELSSTMNKLKLKAKQKIEELESQKKKNVETIDEQLQLIEKLKVESQQPKENPLEMKKANLDEAAGWDDEEDATGHAKEEPEQKKEVDRTGGSSVSDGHSAALQEQITQLATERDTLGKERDSLNEMVANLTAKVQEKEEQVQAQVSQLRSANEEQTKRDSEHEAQITRLMENQNQNAATGLPLLT